MLQLQIESGEVSDGYHTFNELYLHRTILFICLMAHNKKIAWKSKLHSDGSMFPNMFIAGLNIPNIGTVTYHLDMIWFNKTGDKIKELEKAPEWDGHTTEEVFMRLSKFMGQIIHWEDRA